MNSKVRVLLVDDEREFVETLAQRLEIRECEVTTAHSGDEAIDRIQERPIDVMILDVQMPGRDGVSTLQEIKRIAPLIEVIMLTGHATVQTAIDGMKLGAYDYMMKPTDTEALFDKIQKAYLRKADQEDRIRQAEIDRIVQRKGW